jgi:hypothetical protein
VLLSHRPSSGRVAKIKGDVGDEKEWKDKRKPKGRGRGRGLGVKQGTRRPDAVLHSDSEWWLCDEELSKSASALPESGPSASSPPEPLLSAPSRRGRGRHLPAPSPAAVNQPAMVPIPAANLPSVNPSEFPWRACFRSYFEAVSWSVRFFQRLDECTSASLPAVDSHPPVALPPTQFHHPQATSPTRRLVGKDHGSEAFSQENKKEQKSPRRPAPSNKKESVSAQSSLFSASAAPTPAQSRGLDFAGADPGPGGADSRPSYLPRKEREVLSPRDVLLFPADGPVAALGLVRPRALSNPLLFDPLLSRAKHTLPPW